MKKVLKVFGVSAILFIQILLLCMSCATDYVTPCWIDAEAVEYGEANDIPQVLPYTTLHYAKQVGRRISFQHLKKQVEGSRHLEDDKLRHSYIANAHTLHVQESQAWAEKAFSPTGPLGMVMSMSVGSLMLFMPPPGTKKKLEAAKEAGKKEAQAKA